MLQSLDKAANVSAYYLGCPVWSNRAWVGELFSENAKPKDFLIQYASVFNTVEGNTTFYGLPKAATVARWREEAPPGFHFCFKFPRSISHDRKLQHAAAETREFFRCMTPLSGRLGPLFLQLPPAFDGTSLPLLRDYLDSLPADFHYAVEVRHPDFFAKDDSEIALNRLLHERGIDRVVFDSRALFSATDDDADTRAAQRKKPRLPVHVVALGPRPLVRFIGHPQWQANQSFLQPWVEKIAEWIEQGHTPYFFTHMPDDYWAPQLAQLFHQMLQQRLPALGPLPAWPAARRQQDEQLELL
jgi:uncharacterized protein YecE (DUF72 family)